MRSMAETSPSASCSEDLGLCYVVAVSRQQKLWSPDIVQRRVEHYADEVPRKAWRELS